MGTYLLIETSEEELSFRQETNHWRFTLSVILESVCIVHYSTVTPVKYAVICYLKLLDVQFVIKDKDWYIFVLSRPSRQGLVDMPSNYVVLND